MSLKLDLKIFLFLLLFLITSQVQVYILMMVFAIVHELSHLTAGVLLGFRPEELKLTPMGLSLKFKTNSKSRRNMKNGNSLNIKKALIALAGPLANLSIFLVLGIFHIFKPEQTNSYTYYIILYSNFLIGVFNLIPIYPMDGGRIINEILKVFVGNKKAYKITYLLSKTVLIVLTILASIAILFWHNFAIVFIIIYLWYLEMIEIRRYNKRKNIEKIVKDVENKEHNMV